MLCTLCDKKLLEGEYRGFVCICDKCFELLEKEEKRRTELICGLVETIKLSNVEEASE